MPNNQLHTLTTHTSLDSRDLLVVVDRSELTTHKIEVGEISDALDGTIFLSSSYSLTSSFTIQPERPISTSFAYYANSASFSSNLSGSNVIAAGSSFAHLSMWANAVSDFIQVTASSDYIDIYGIGNSGGQLRFVTQSNFVNSYLIRPISHRDVMGSQILNPTIGSVTYYGLPAGSYGFEISLLDYPGKILTFFGDISFASPVTTTYSLIHYFESGGVYNASGSGVFSITSSYSDTADISENSKDSHWASSSVVTSATSRISTTAISASRTTSSLFSQRSNISNFSSNGPIPGMILLYAGIQITGSENWLSCNGSTYDIAANSALSASIGSKFSQSALPLVPNVLPNISSNVESGSGPFNERFYISETTLGHPTNNQISQSYGVNAGGSGSAESFTGSYASGSVYGTEITGWEPRAFYYNIKR
jgi:microcystin-dependent protein